MRNSVSVAVIAIIVGCCVLVSAKKQCEPGARFLDDDQCNWCTCESDGETITCTKKACILEPSWMRKREATEQTCEPGSRFLDAEGCNWCTCSSDGKLAACTKKFCFKQAPVRSDRKTRGVGSENKRCEPGSVFLDDDGCNRCKCNAEGTGAACTRKFCRKPELQGLSNSRPTRDVKTCVPGVNFLAADGCNWCTCNADGTPGGCTEKGCFEKLNIRKTRDLLKDGKRCEPGSHFFDEDGCNRCVCSADGMLAACTRKLCIKRTQQERVTRASGNFCTPRTTYKEDCNTCRCSDDGKTAACTYKFCIPTEGGRVRRNATELAEGQVCVPNTTFKDEENCNTCRCNDKGTYAACTLKFCLPIEKEPSRTRREEPKTVCEPDSTFKIQCNTCHCNSDGTSAACTLIGCVSVSLPEQTRIRRQEPKKVCEPNTTFKDDCNTCRCNEDGTVAACTEIGCPQKVCEPNALSRAQDGCNTCRCNEWGTALSCTEIDCPKLGGIEDGVCTPNSVFQKDCNMCKCSDDGSRSYCTRRQCNRSRRSDDASTTVGSTNDNDDKEAVVATTGQTTACVPDDVKIEVGRDPIYLTLTQVDPRFLYS